jgi:hypothetical protein
VKKTSLCEERETVHSLYPWEEQLGICTEVVSQEKLNRTRRARKGTARESSPSATLEILIVPISLLFCVANNQEPGQISGTAVAKIFHFGVGLKHVLVPVRPC